MVNVFGIEMQWLDLFSLLWFVSLWVSYSLLANHRPDNNLVKTIHKFRVRWMSNMMKRPDRLVDIKVISNTINTSIVMASTSVVVVIALVIFLFNSGEKAVATIGAMSFDVTLQMWVLKTSLLLVIFAFSFFKFTWVIRQSNYLSVMVLAAPVISESENPEDAKISAQYVTKIATIITNVSRHFNMGMRSYYFGMAAISWYASPALFMALSVLVVCVLYRREFMSKTLILLT